MQKKAKGRKKIKNQIFKKSSFSDYKGYLKGNKIKNELKFV